MVKSINNLSVLQREGLLKELSDITEILTNKNLERLLWCAQGLETNASQLKHTRNTQKAVKAHEIAT